MKTQNPNMLKPIIEQVTNNTTGWIGHHPRNHNEISCGQTFLASHAADIDAIEVYSNIVSQPGNVQMTVHNYDPGLNRWGPVLSYSNVDMERSDSGKWIVFNMPSIHMDEGKTYGFRLESQDSFVGFGEAAGSAQHPPFITGQEWQFSNDDISGKAFSYFSLAFKVEKRA